MTRYLFRPCCGLTRSVPAETRPGDLFVLGPCLQCASTFFGRLHHDDQIEELPWPKHPAELNRAAA